MTRAAVVLGLAFVFCATAVQAQKIDVDHNPNTNFNGLKTFAWDPDNPLPPTLPDLNANRVEAAVRASAENYLRSRGFYQVMSDADFLLSYTFSGVSDPGSSAPSEEPHPVEQGWSPFAERGAADVGDRTLVLTVRDARKKTVCWQARAPGVLVPDKKFDRNIDKIVKKMLSKFPPR